MSLARRAAGFLGVSVAATLLGACGPTPHACMPPHCPYTAEQASALPDSQIFYPGSQVISRTATKGETNVNGEPEDARVVTRLNTPASEDVVAAWYQLTLAKSGWKQIEHSVYDGHGFYAFTKSPPSAASSEVIYVDFRFPPPTDSGTDYQVDFRASTP